ncbi:hypothetical protein BGW38_009674, partial [Lunasporangiospora selenospora]
MSILVVLVIVISVVLFSLLFLYLYRVYRQLQVRHAKPLHAPNSLAPVLEQHQELAYVLAHGVEAYNQLRRQRQRTQQLQQQQDNSEVRGDSASAHSSITGAGIEPPPLYTVIPVNGDVGYGWRSAAPPEAHSSNDS